MMRAGQWDATWKDSQREEQMLSEIVGTDEVASNQQLSRLAVLPASVLISIDLVL